MSVRLAFFISALLVLAVVHIVAIELYLYWKFLWLDIPMHILGGVCVALAWSLLPLLRIRISARMQTLMWCLTAVFMVGVAWECFEYGAGISLVREENFIFDTIIDLVMDLTGGIIGYGVAKITASLPG